MIVSGHFGRLAEMAPNQNDVDLQTSEIIRHLLEDEFVAGYGKCQFSHVETDSPGGSDGEFVFRFICYLQAALVFVVVIFCILLNAHSRGDLLYISALFLIVDDTYGDRQTIGSSWISRFPSDLRTHSPDASPLNNSLMSLCVSDGFNAVLIAGKLISIADSLNDNVVFKEALNEFKKEATKGVSRRHQAVHCSLLFSKSVITSRKMTPGNLV